MKLACRNRADRIGNFSMRQNPSLQVKRMRVMIFAAPKGGYGFFLADKIRLLNIFEFGLFVWNGRRFWVCLENWHCQSCLAAQKQPEGLSGSRIFAFARLSDALSCASASRQAGNFAFSAKRQRVWLRV